jgi:hypothetical protein
MRGCELWLTDLLAVAAGTVHPRLQTAFNALMAAPRPQSVHDWLTPDPAADLLRAMATGEMVVSHERFADLPHDRAVIFVRPLEPRLSGNTRGRFQQTSRHG